MWTYWFGEREVCARTGCNTVLPCATLLKDISILSIQGTAVANSKNGYQESWIITGHERIFPTFLHREAGIARKGFFLATELVTQTNNPIPISIDLMDFHLRRTIEAPKDSLCTPLIPKSMNIKLNWAYWGRPDRLGASSVFCYGWWIEAQPSYQIMIGMADFSQLVYLYRVQRRSSNTVKISSEIITARYAQNDNTLGWCLRYTKRMSLANSGKFFTVSSGR